MRSMTRLTTIIIDAYIVGAQVILTAHSKNDDKPELKPNHAQFVVDQRASNYSVDNN